MSHSRRILLVTPVPELLHNKLLENHGYVVTVVRSYANARRVWKAEKFHLVLVVAGDDLISANRFCEEIKQESREQNVAVLAGWNAYIPGDSCPDEVIRQNYDPEGFLLQVSRLL